MRILFFIVSLHSGGAERVTANLANYWAEMGREVTIVTLTSESNDFYMLNPAIRRIGLNLAGGSNGLLHALFCNFNRLLALRSVLRQVKPDIAISMMSSANILLALATFRKKRMLTIGSEHTYPPRIPLGKIWEYLRKTQYGNLDSVTALTSESAVWLAQHTNSKVIKVIPNAAPWPLPLHSPIVLPPVKVADTKLLLAVGRLSEEKGFHHLIRIFEKISVDLEDWQLYIVGDGPEREILQAEIDLLSMQNRIHLVGRVGNLGDWYEMADIYVMTSRFEGFGNTLAEAMTYGIPAVSFDCTAGPRDIIRHEVDGALVPADDVVLMEKSLRRLMQDGSLRKKWGEKAKEARTRFSLAKVGGMWDELFAELV